MRLILFYIVSMFFISCVYASTSYTLPFKKIYIENEIGDVVELRQDNEKICRIEVRISGIETLFEDQNINNINYVDSQTIELVYSAGLLLGKTDSEGNIEGEFSRTATLKFVSMEESSGDKTLHKFIFKNGKFHKRIDEKL